MRDTLIIGGSGMLGRALLAECRREGREADSLRGREDLDVTDAAAVRAMLATRRPAVVINAAGYTDVDRAEAEPQVADRVNRGGAANVARACAEAGAALVHVSTDYIFDGRARRPYREEDLPHPINAYGQSKLAGECAVVSSGCDHLIVRTSWVFAPHGRNFVRSILHAAAGAESIAVVDDQRGSPTVAGDAARMILALLERGVRGLLHVANAGNCTRYELARAAVARAGLPCVIRPCATRDVPRPARRPAFSVLDVGRAAAIIGPPRPWEEALRECVDQLRPTLPAAAPRTAP